MMEAQTPLPTRRSLTRLALIASLIVTAVSGAAFFLILMTTGDAFVRGEASGIYWLYVNRSQTLLVLSLISCGAVWFAMLLPSVILDGINLLERLLLSIVVAILYIALLTLAGPQISDVSIQYVHGASIKTGTTVYRTGGVLTHWFMAGIAQALDDSPDSEPVYAYTCQPIVFACDSRGILCHTIYHGTEKLYVEPPITELTTSGSNITLTVNDVRAWTHPTDQ
jgi:hypothetical protein